MTLEQTMHTLESHLEALQAEYDRLLARNKVLEKKVEALNSRLNFDTLATLIKQMKKKLCFLLEENNQLKEQLKALSDNSTLKPASLNPYYAFETYMKTWQLNPRKKYDVQVKKGNAFIYYLDLTLEPVEYVSSGGGCMVEFKFTSPLQEEPILVSSGSDHLFAIRESNTQGASNA
jgi:cell division protein FtsB